MTKLRQFSAGLVLAGMIAYAPQVLAVTVEIDIVTEGEPVPTAIISFETEDGEPVDITELVELDLDEAPPPVEESEESQPETALDETGPDVVPPDDTATATAETVPETDEIEIAQTPSRGIRVELPDEFVDQPLVMLVREDDRLVKRQPVRLTPETALIEVEAYDPADAEIAVSLDQPETCRRGQPCTYEIAVHNEGDGIYEGPLFLTGPLHGTVADAAADTSAWWCAGSGGGRQICHADVVLEPGEAQTSSVTARLPRRLASGASNCLEVADFAQTPGERVDPVVKAVQMGLARNGIDPGPADGIHGRKTEAAIATFLERQGLAAATEPAQLFEILFGLPLRRFARLGIDAEDGRSCSPLALVPAPRQDKPVAKTKTPQRPKKERARAEQPALLEDPAVSIGIGIGLGILGERLHKGRRNHNRPERRERRERIEQEQWYE